MKKFIILLGTLLFAAVFMSGCVADIEDPVVGIWQSIEPMQHPSGNLFDPVTYIFNEDGTGYCLATFSDGMVSGKINFIWRNLGGGTYERLVLASDENVFVLEASEFTLADGKITVPSVGGVAFDFYPADLADYAPGLWISDLFDYQEYEDVKVMLYLGEDGTGNVALFDQDVADMDDVFTGNFTWKAAEDKIVIAGEGGGTFELALINGGLSFDNIEPMHKYTVQDHVTGLWISDEPVISDGVSYDVVELIKSDGTGVEMWTIPDSHTASEKYDFTWDMIDAYSYKAFYEDGDEWSFSFGGDRQIFDGTVWYTKVSFDVLTDYMLKVTT